ncbi:MAG: 50S ribosomal protein L27 [bacterium]|nr:50S ribosomal protein L27 [bacterium]
MAHKKAGGSAKNLRDSKPKYLGIKLYDGEKAQPGAIIVRQRGSRILAGENTKIGKDHTIFASSEGTVQYSRTRKTHFNGRQIVKKVANVVV